MTQWVLGLDLSLRSPGFAIRHPCGQWSLLAFSQTQTRRPTNACITLCNKIPSAFQTDVQRYHYIVDALFTWLRTFTFDFSQLHTIFEGYVFNPRTSGHSYKLHELGGIIRYQLYLAGVRSVHVVAPSTWQRTLVHKDKKWGAIHRIATRYNISLFGLYGDLPCVYDRPVPNPIQDMADAMCLVDWYLTPKTPLSR